MIIIALVILVSSFHFTEFFWFSFPLSMIILLGRGYSEIGTNKKWIGFPSALCGLFSGILLYLCFALGKSLIMWLKLPLLQELNFLYQTVSPRVWWHYVLLFLIIIPGEEFFWRGYVRQKLMSRYTPLQSIFISAVLYAAVHLLSGNVLLGMAALVAGIFWGGILFRTQSMGAVILSHLIFDLLLLVLFPLG